MKLVHIADLRVVGGVERMLVNFIQALPQVQHYLILQTKEIHPDLMSINTLVQGIYSSKHFSGIPLFKKMRAWNRIRLVNMLEADCVLIWNQVVPLERVCVPCIYYEHGSAWYDHSQDIIRRCFDYVKHVVAVSYAAKEVLRLKHGVNTSVTVVHNTLMSMPEDIKPRVLKRLDTVVLGVAGRLVSVKAVAILILVLAGLVKKGINASVKIAGTGKEQDRLSALVKQLGMSDRVVFLGLMQDMTCFYRQIDFYVSPSLHESFGLTCLEASSYGIPVIVADVDGLPEIVKDGVTGFCIEPELSIEHYLQLTGAEKPNVGEVYYPKVHGMDKAKALEPERIVEKIMLLLSEPQKYEEMSAQACQAAKEVYSFPELCQKVLAVCESV